MPRRPKPFMEYRPSTPYRVDLLIDSMSDKELMTHMGIPTRYQSEALKVELAGLPFEVEGWLKELKYIYRPNAEMQEEKNLCGMGLIFYGPPSTRKTTTAAALLLRVIRMGILNLDPAEWALYFGRCMGVFTSWQEASETLRDASSNDEVDQMNARTLKDRMMGRGDLATTGNFLVVDDISRERGTEFNQNELQRIVRHRHEWGLGTIITTNHSPDEWDGVYTPSFAAILKRAFIAVDFG